MWNERDYRIGRRTERGRRFEVEETHISRRTSQAELRRITDEKGLLVGHAVANIGADVGSAVCLTSEGICLSSGRQRRTAGGGQISGQGLGESHHLSRPLGHAPAKKF